MNLPENDSLNSPGGRDADEYQWAEFNLPSDLMADQTGSASGAPVLAPATSTELG